MSTSSQVERVQAALSARRERRRWGRDLARYATPAERLELVALLDHADGAEVDAGVRTAVLRPVA